MGTVRLFRILARAVFIRRLRSTPCAKEALWRATSLRLCMAGEKRPFRYSTVGQLAAIGRHMGVANILGVNFSGFFAWWLWRTIYLSKLPRMEKKIRVALDWTLDLCFPKDFACVTTPARGRARSTSALRARGEAAAQGGSSSENRRARLERSHERL